MAAALAASTLALLPGCFESPDCGVCDKDNLVLTSISGPNYTGDLVHLVSPTCEGRGCPAPFDDAKYFLDDIGPCLESDAAESYRNTFLREGEAQTQSEDPPDRGMREYCKITPLVVSSGLQFIFNNLLEPTTIELVRARPDNPNLLEVYDWKTRILSVRGPGTRYSGDWRRDATTDVARVTRLVNLTCVGNTPGYDDTSDDDPATNPCNAFDVVDDQLRPRKMTPAGEDQTFTAPRGRWDDRALGEANELDCDDPQDGADTCCSQCDFALTSQVAKYGLAESADTDEPMDAIRDRLARPGLGAIECDSDGDRLLECAGFRPWTSRRDETLPLSWPGDADATECAEQAEKEACRAIEGCTWDSGACQKVGRGITWADHLRELHPADRPAGAERANAACTSTAECRDPGQRALPGTECIGTNADDEPCAVDAGDPACTQGRCLAEWFVACRADTATTGAQGYCVDVRHDANAAPGCTVAQQPCKEGLGTCTSTDHDERISSCDADGNGQLTAAECCEGGEACDPTYAPNADPLALYERAATLQGRTRDCRCSDLEEEGCTAYGDPDSPDYNVIEQTCSDDEDEHDYAVNFVTRLGGVIYELSLKGIQWRPADLGGTPRAAIEACAEQRGLIDPRNVDDGWRAHDAEGIAIESYEDFDRGMCSGQVYTVEFATDTSDDAHQEVLVDKAGNTLRNKSTYTFETPEFHVVPDSGFPSDALRIGACDEFTLQFSNKYDLSPENLAKVEIRDDDGTTIAGGPGCSPTAGDGVPCLLVNVAEQAAGRFGVRIDPIVYGPVLVEGTTYELFVPGVQDISEAMDDEAVYRGAFWDVCGMPLVLPYGGRTGYDFTIDPASCRDDADGDGIQRSCDNADDVPNPDQSDLDGDGFGDAADPCPTLATAGPETGDTDRDGVGNACDSCALAAERYNENAIEAGLPPEYFARNIPSQTDADSDGIGDVCDNCPSIANCGAFGPETPYQLGADRPTDESECQTDIDDDLVGDACDGKTTEGAAGPVGFGDLDDFDQDGLVNQADRCPRQPVGEAIACNDVTPCADGSACTFAAVEDTTGICNHLDSDADGVGDVCDTCPYAENGLQRFDGTSQEDDEDGDFIGADCELDLSCATEHGPRPFAFYEVAVGGQCCVTALREDEGAIVVVATGLPLLDPDGLPVRRDCDDEGGSCRALPTRIAALPGMLEPPTGCLEALEAAGITDPSETPQLDASDVDGQTELLWQRACSLPPSDLDFDGIGDACDLCVFGFDPDNAPYTDEQGKLWPHDGAVCSGAYADACEGEDDDGAESDDDAGASSDGGDSSG